MRKYVIGTNKNTTVLIQSSLAPIRTSIEVFQETVTVPGQRLTSVETTAAENSEK